MADTEAKRHPLVEDYLEQLERAAGKLPRAERKELLAETERYLDQAVRPDANQYEVRSMLGSLGTPEALAAQERPKRIKPDPQPTEGSAIVLLAIGGLFIGIGWFFGLYLLWRSKVFTADGQADRHVPVARGPGERDDRGDRGAGVVRPAQRADRDRRARGAVPDRVVPVAPHPPSLNLSSKASSSGCRAPIARM